jgi:hypothetical protein
MPEIQPQRQQLLEFHNKLNAVLQPLDALKRPITADVAEAMKAVYPTLWGKLQNAAMDEIQKNPEAEHEASVQQQLSLILGQKIGPGSDPQQTAMNAAAFARAAQIQQQQEAQKQATRQKQSVKVRSPAELYSLNPTELRTR